MFSLIYQSIFIVNNILIDIYSFFCSIISVTMTFRKQNLQWKKIKVKKKLWIQLQFVPV